MKLLKITLSVVLCLSFTGGPGLAQTRQRPRPGAPTGPATTTPRTPLPTIDADPALFEDPKPEWERIGSTKEEIVLINNWRIERRDQRTVRAWFKSVRKEGVIIEGRDLAYSHTIELLEADCAEGRYRTLQATEYAFQGRTLSNIQPEAPKWSYAIPGSVGETMLVEACARTLETKRR